MTPSVHVMQEQVRENFIYLVFSYIILINCLAFECKYISLSCIYNLFISIQYFLTKIFLSYQKQLLLLVNFTPVIHQYFILTRYG